MSRLIDADDIKYQLLKPNTNPTLWCVSKDAVDLMPTVDAVPVVRCRDCKHGKPYRTYYNGCNGIGYRCERYDGYFDSDWFCADGEKVSE